MVTLDRETDLRRQERELIERRARTAHELLRAKLERPGPATWWNDVGTDVFIELVAARITPDEAATVRAWRTTGSRGSWGSVAVTSHRDLRNRWRLDWEGPDLDEVGMAIGIAAAHRLGEDPTAAPWTPEGVGGASVGSPALSATLADRADPRRRRAERFAYVGVDVDEAEGVVRCRYDLDGRAFTEEITFGPGLAWTPAAHEAARLLFLLAAVSYYKAGAPPVVDLGATPVRPGELDLLRSFYVDGLGEFAVRNDLDLTGIELVGGRPAPPVPAAGQPARPDASTRPLIPFGGGLDSIVTVELLRSHVTDPALFVVDRAGYRFESIERAAAVTGLPVVRAEREIDPTLVRPTDDERARWFNGHVPVTGIISAIAVLAAVLHGRSAVVMSNEWSASSGNVRVGGRDVNHQFSKSETFEAAWRAVLAEAVPTVDYFSFLRPFSELWIAQRFAGMHAFHPVFHSCNRAFHLDPAERLDHWCGECDKCVFIDLILSPFLPRTELDAIFDGREPLANPALADRFRRLLATVDDPKPFECVGDVDECRAALVLAAERADRNGPEHSFLHQLVDELGPAAVEAADDGSARLLRPMGVHHIPDALLAAAPLR
ncbi:MAG: endonuclease domain-containing protein [Acidimicrobiia bacterium]|nr:endonuclease domain-containing protein [Acidimicrobiia bacterium]